FLAMRASPRARRQSMRRPVIGHPRFERWPDTVRGLPRLPPFLCASGRPSGLQGERGAARNSGGEGSLQAQRKGLSKVNCRRLVLSSLPPSGVRSPFLELLRSKIHLL